MQSNVRCHESFKKGFDHPIRLNLRGPNRQKKQMAQSFQQLQKQIEVLKAKAEQIKLAELKGVVAKIRAAIDAYGITSQDLFGSSAKSTPTKQLRGPSRPGEAKFSDGKGNTWVGRGKRPQWIRDALQAGSKLEDFLGRANSPATESGAPAAAVERGRKRAQGKAGRIKYRDNAGNAWSGRGPRPRWLTDALAAGKSLDDLRA